MMKLGGPMQQARNFAVMTGVNAGVLTLMRRIRKVDDVNNSLAAAFASGSCFSLVSGMGGAAAPGAAAATGNPLMGALSAGVVFAAFQGAIYKLGEAFSGPKVADTDYARVHAMLTSLGLSVRGRSASFLQLLGRRVMFERRLHLGASAAGRGSGRGAPSARRDTSV